MNARTVYWNFTLLILVMAKKKLKEQEIIQRTLKDYDWRVRPRGSNHSWPGIIYNLILYCFYILYCYIILYCLDCYIILYCLDLILRID